MDATTNTPSGLDVFTKLIADTVRGNPQSYFFSSESEHAQDKLNEEIDEETNVQIPSQSPPAKSSTSNENTTVCNEFLTSIQKLMHFGITEIEKAKTEFDKEFTHKDQILLKLEKELQVKTNESKELKETLENSISMKNNEISKLRSELSTSLEFNQKSKNRIEELTLERQNESNTFKQQLLDAKNQIEKANKEISSLKMEKERESQLFASENANMKNTLEELKQKHIELLLENEKLRGEKGKEEEILEMKENMISELKDWKRKYEETFQSSTLLSKKLETAQNQIHFLQQKLSQSQQPIASQTVASTPSVPVDQKLLISKDGEIKILRSRLDSREQEIQTLRSQLSSTKIQDVNWKHQFEREIEKLRTQLLFKDQELKTLSDQLSNLNAQRADAATSPSSSPLYSTTPNLDETKKRKRVISKQGSPMKAPKLSEGAMQLLKASQALSPSKPKTAPKSPVNDDHHL